MSDNELDRQLVRRFREHGDAEALAELQRIHGPAVYRAARAKVGDHHLAEDIAQQTWLRFAASIQAYDDSRPLGPWLTAIAHNLAISLLRKKSHSEVPMADVPERPQPDEDANKLDQINAMYSAIQQLPSELRAVALQRARGDGRGQIAHALGVSESTAYRRMQEVLAALRLRLVVPSLEFWLSFDPQAISRGRTATGTIILDHPAPCALCVRLTSSGVSVTVPKQTAIAPGDVSADFPVVANGQGGNPARVEITARISSGNIEGPTRRATVSVQ